jgi:DNA-binding transcriptional LysR family regulator
LAASPTYIAKYGTLDHPKQLHDHKCLVYKGFEGPNRWLVRKPNEEWVHYPIVPLLASNNAESLMMAALHGMGIILFPDWLIGEALKNGKLIKLLPQYESSIKSQPQHIAAIYPNVRHPPLNIRVIIDYFAEVYGETPYWQN